MNDAKQQIAEDDPSQASFAAAENTDGESRELADGRIDRILEHIDHSLKLRDALQATVGAASGDLMLMQYRLRQALDESLQQTPDSLTALAEIMPAMTAFLKVSQQVDRFIQLSLKIKMAKKEEG